MQKITIRLPQQQAEMLNLLVSTGEYTSVSEAIRAAIRDLIRSREDKLIERLDYLSKMS
ncbi:MAG: ribbon-helix-helix domain-containing protein [Methermicoccaceae archaeon]